MTLLREVLVRQCEGLLEDKGNGEQSQRNPAPQQAAREEPMGDMQTSIFTPWGRRERSSTVRASDSTAGPQGARSKKRERFCFKQLCRSNEKWDWRLDNSHPGSSENMKSSYRKQYRWISKHTVKWKKPEYILSRSLYIKFGNNKTNQQYRKLRQWLPWGRKEGLALDQKEAWGGTSAMLWVFYFLTCVAVAWVYTGDNSLSYKLMSYGLLSICVML